MTLVIGDVENVLGVRVDGFAQFWAPTTAVHAGVAVVTDAETVPINDGAFTAEVTPGRCRIRVVVGSADAFFDVNVPDVAEITFSTLIEGVVEYEPAVVTEVSRLVDEARRITAVLGSAEQIKTWTAEADADAQAAAQSASDAQSFEVAAGSSATAAAGSATAAKQSETAAKSSEGTASSAASTAVAKAGEATSASSAAGSSASSAASSAVAAKNSETAAAGSATDAAGARDSAQSYAGAAQTQAQAAQASADRIGSAETVQQWVTDATTQAGRAKDEADRAASSLAGKADKVHTHPIADVTNLQSTLDGKAPAVHTHATADINGLSAYVGEQVANSTQSGGAIESYAKQVVDQTAQSAVQTNLNGRELTSGEDVKTLGIGNYAAKTNAIAASIVNAPAGIAAVSTVSVTGSTAGAVLKTIKWTEWNSAGARTWACTVSGSSQSAWTRIDGMGRQGSDTADLNSLTTPEDWWWVNDANTSLARNFPIAKAGHLKVERWGASNNTVIQTYRPFRHDGYFVRFFYSGTPYKTGTRADGWVEYKNSEAVTALVDSRLSGNILRTPRSSAVKIDCLGDSLTAGYSGASAWAASDAWPAQMASSLGAHITVNNYGSSGATSDQIVLSTGVQPILCRVVGGTLAGAAYSVTNLRVSQNLAAYAKPGQAFAMYGYLNGIDGKIETDGTAWKFTSTVTAPSQTVDAAWFVAKGKAADPTSTIIAGMGRNDVTKVEKGMESTVVDHVIRGYRDILEFATPLRKQVAFLGTITRTDESPGSTGFQQVKQINDYLRTQHPDRHIDLQGYLTGSTVWADTGITPTQADLDAQALGKTPPSLFDDVTHYNRATAKAIGQKLIGPWLLARGWILPN